MQRKRRARRVVLIALAVLVGYLGGCLLLARTYLRPIRTVPALPTGFSEIAIPASPYPIPAWEAGPASAPVTFLFAHGYGGSRADWTETMRGLADAGYHSVALAMPGQDASPDPTVGFGIKEADAIEAAVRELRRMRPNRPIVLVGLSMGGAAAWIAAGRGAEVSAVVTEGAYADFGEASRGWIGRLFPGARWVLSPVIPLGRWMSGLDPDRERPVDGAAKWRGPSLVIQGEEDRLIGRSHADRLADAADAPLWMVEGARHAQCQSVAPIDYQGKLRDVAHEVATKPGK